MRREEQIRKYYYTLYSAWGRQHWWPAQSRFEVIVGAYLTQNTSWSNVEKALNNLRQARKLNLFGVRELTLPTLERLIRSAGYFRQKARQLKIFVQFLDQTYGGSLQRMFAQPTAQVRQQLLDLEGVGPGTADAILLVRETILCSWWMPTRGAYWRGTDWHPQRLDMKTSASCFNRRWRR